MTTTKPSPRHTCDTCKDTHTMALRDYSGDERQVPCTRCPVPCPKCRGARSAYCWATPCDCECHTRRPGEKTTARRALADLEADPTTKPPVGTSVHKAIQRLAKVGDDLAAILSNPTKFPDCDSDYAIREWEMARDELPHVGIDL